ncbi:MAG TPA: 4Fe-4S dicluster domain-containing protein [Dehalococcoidia bacterium]|nr:4Fe-4S dicluster domain-containing protein [Dehalococcoidia bacterium]
MATEYTLVVNSADCVGCNACEVACKQEHNISVGPRWIRVYPDTPREIEGKLQLRYIVTHCMHCSRPSCKDVCPVDAISKREDGIVLVNDELCIGCKDCIDACPLGVMQFDEDKAVAQKCDMCAARIDIGRQPACMDACPSHCIYFGDVSKVTEVMGKKKLVAWYKGITI